MIRIYTLAKELNIESKSLVDICKKAGLNGKGSALASLTDEEVDQVKSYLKVTPPVKSVKEILADADSLSMQRPSVTLSSGKIPVLKPIRPVRLPDRASKKAEAVPAALEPELKAEPKSEVKPEPKAETKPETKTEAKAEAKAESQSAASVAETVETAEKVEKTAAEPKKKSKGAAEPAKYKESALSDAKKDESAESAAKPKKMSPLKSLLHPTRKEKETTAEPVETVEPVKETKPLSPLELARRAAAMERMQRPHVIGEGDSKKKKSSGDGEGKSAKSGKPQVAIHLAPLPTNQEKPVKKAGKEPTPQKPEIRLAPATIRAASEGKSAPLKDIMREQERKAGQGRSADKEGDGSTRAKDGRRTVKVKPGEVYVGTDLFDESQDKKGKRSKDRRRGDEPEDAQKKRRPATRDSRTGEEETFDRFRPRQHRKRTGRGTVSTAPRKGDIVIEMPCTVKEFAEATGLSVAAVIKKTMEFGAMLTINRPLDLETAELLVEAFELKAQVRKERTLEDMFVLSAMEQEDPEETLRPRAPVVTFLGHVDHGKTSLLDKILKLDVVSGEKGGITQHIRSYRIRTEKGDVTFVDTPGHEAFTEMRARGANCTDIAVLVVAADDGVMPQTEEAISHAKAAGVPIVVALNKMDLPGVNRDRVVQELAANDLMPSEWGGDVEIVETSAVTGSGIDALMETLLMVAELNELKARPDRSATGVAIESSLEPGQGVICKLLVQNGTLKDGDVVLCGNAYGKVRAMFDTLDASRELKEAGPSTPVTVLGLDVVPPAGSKFVVLDDISVARQIAEERTAQVHERELSGADEHVTLETLKERLTGSKTQQTLNIIIRADVRGSIEAIRKELSKLDHPEVKIKILQASVGGITEADVLLADASDAIVVGFSVVPDERARVLAEQKKVQIRRYDIIYKLSEEIKAALEGMLKPIEQVKELGRALVQRTFTISRIGTIAGCRVLSGTMERDCRIRVIRDSRIIGEYQLDTLKREKDDAREVREGYECGIKLKGYNDLKEGDVFEAYKIEEIARTL